MHPLHRSDDAQFGEARDIVRMQMLRMFDSPTPWQRGGILFKQLFVNIQYFSIGSVANCMNTDLIVVGDCKLSCAGN